MEFSFDQYLPMADIPLCFNLAMMTQLDEVDSERCAEMSFVEFMEAFARLAEYANLPHISKEFPQDLSEAELRAQPLWVKTEALLKVVANHHKIPKKISQTFGIPKNSLFNSRGELIDE